MSIGTNPLLDALRRAGAPLPKPRVFVSYHHENDQLWYDTFSRLFRENYDVFTDTSLERKVDSDDSDNIRRAIRERNITGSSLTIVLCGAETWKRRWVDWEIQMTLNKQHALLGIALPACAKNAQGQCIVPERLHDNIQSTYAAWFGWPQSVQARQTSITESQVRAKTISNIRNKRPAMQKSKP